MTADDRFARTLSTWLREEAEHRVPDHVTEVLVRTAATRQRRWWSSLERLIPMTTMTTERVHARRSVLWLAVIALVSLAAIGAILAAASLRETPTPLGPASNGRILVADGSILYSYAADGTDRRELTRFSGGSHALAVSPDGTRLAFTTNSMGPVIHLVTVADGDSSELVLQDVDLVAEEPVGWSPDGRSIVFVVGVESGRDAMYIADIATGSVRPFAPVGLDRELGPWQPSYSPDGIWIAFGTRGRDTSAGTLYVVHPDGTGLRALDTPPFETQDGPGGPLWAADRDTHRIAYPTLSGGALVMHMFDLDTDADHTLVQGFWPAWSPDGSRLATCCGKIINIEDVLRFRSLPTTAFGQPGQGYCPDLLDWSGRAICSVVVWSPDAKWLIAGDIAGRDLLLAPVDGSQPPKRIELTSGSDMTGQQIPVAWQPIWP